MCSLVPSRFTTMTAIVAGYILLLVVVCPATPTPVAVSKGKQVDIALAAVPVLAALVHQPVVTAEHPLEVLAVAAPDRLALTCSRLC